MSVRYGELHGTKSTQLGLISNLCRVRYTSLTDNSLAKANSVALKGLPPFIRGAGMYIKLNTLEVVPYIRTQTYETYVITVNIWICIHDCQCQNITFSMSHQLLRSMLFISIYGGGPLHLNTHTYTLASYFKMITRMLSVNDHDESTLGQAMARCRHASSH